MQLTIFLLVLTFLFSCGRERSKTDTTSPTTAKNETVQEAQIKPVPISDERKAINRLATLHLKHLPSIVDIKEKFGEPLNLKSVREKNPLGYKNFITTSTIEFDGLEIILVKIENKSMLHQVTLTKEHELIRPIIPFGMHRSQVEKRLGKIFTREDSLEYYGDSGATVTLYFEENRVVKINWFWDID